ncbi:MAG: radical SAM family heme chaperone HemW [Verrucomicrobiales bacterium]
MHLYVHIPFCHRIGPYCSFHKHTPGGHDLRAFFRAVIAEAQRAVEQHGGSAPRTVYFGGGTPTLPGRAVLAEFLEAFRRVFDLSGVEEWTVEANPRTFDSEKIRLLLDHGVTRVSLGVQAWDAATLATLGRDHAPDEARAAFEILRAAGVPSVNVDLMFSIPGQSLETWAATVHTTLALQPDHVSAYNLNYEEDTEFFDRLSRGEFRTDEEADASHFLLADAQLSAAGYDHYEISNYARPGHHSRHNQSYWHGADYLGIGPGAFSTVGGRRWKNVAETKTYVERALSGQAVESEIEVLSADALRRERIALLLRTTAGVPLDLLSPSALAKLPALAEAGLAFPPAQGRLALTPQGRLVADSVAVELW